MASEDEIRMSNVGRNESCPCGSGIKYKNCCLRKIGSYKFTNWKANATEILADELHKDSILAAFFTTLDFVEKKDWAEACHAVSAVLYVMYSELGLTPTLCVGEVKCDRDVFDHSWVELNGEVFDVSIYKNIDNVITFAPIINGYDVDTKEPTKAVYGVKSVIGLDPDTQKITNVPFDIYMSGFPDYENGLWGIVIDLGAEISLDLDLDLLKGKYSQTSWHYRKAKYAVMDDITPEIKRARASNDTRNSEYERLLRYTSKQ